MNTRTLIVRALVGVLAIVAGVILALLALAAGTYLVWWLSGFGG